MKNLIQLIAMVVCIFSIASPAFAQADVSMENDALRKALEQAMRENIALRADLDAARAEIGRMRGNAERPLAMSMPTGTLTMTAMTEAVTHTVEKGETLGKIAEQHYHAVSAYKKIFEANRNILSDPNKISVGQVLRIP